MRKKLGNIVAAGFGALLASQNSLAQEVGEKMPPLQGVNEVVVSERTSGRESIMVSYEFVKDKGILKNVKAYLNCRGGKIPFLHYNGKKLLVDYKAPTGLDDGYFFLYPDGEVDLVKEHTGLKFGGRIEDDVTKLFPFPRPECPPVWYVYDLEKSFKS